MVTKWSMIELDKNGTEEWKIPKAELIYNQWSYVDWQIDDLSGSSRQYVYQQ